MLDQPYMTDLIEANSMGHKPDEIQIYSASWGPTDDGKTVDGPRNATMRAIVKGVNEVRDELNQHWIWGMDKWLHPCNAMGCNYFSMYHHKSVVNQTYFTQTRVRLSDTNAHPKTNTPRNKTKQ